MTLDVRARRCFDVPAAHRRYFPRASVGARRRTAAPAIATFGLAAFAGLAGCAREVAVQYGGTGSLAESGSPVQLLESHAPVLVTCPTEHAAGGSVEPFRVLALGPACVLDASGYEGAFIADPGSTCALSFGDEVRALRVTDVGVFYAVTARHRGWSASDASAVSIQIGGEDAASHVHAVYRFTGSRVAAVPSWDVCAAQRALHVARVPSALRRDEASEPVDTPDMHCTSPCAASDPP